MKVITKAWFASKYIISFRLNPAEIAFLAEYVAVMKPVTLALTVLQSGSNIHMGCLLPTVFH